MATQSTPPSHDRTKDDPIVLDFHDSLLRQSDVSILNGPQWLNDRIITFFFEYLQNFVFKDEDAIAFVCPEVVQLLKIADESDVRMTLESMGLEGKEHVFMAVNDSRVTDSPSGTHWSLLVYRSPDTFHHYDSFSNFNESSARDLVRKLSTHMIRGTSVSDVKFVSCESPQQVNDYDCGIHVIMNSLLLARHFVFGDPIDWYDTRDAMLNERKRLKDLIFSLKRSQFCRDSSSR